MTRQIVLHSQFRAYWRLSTFLLNLLSFQGSMAYSPKGKGSSVCKEVVEVISGIFPNDHKFLCRIAWVESKYGNDPGTYRPGYHGGIWQVDEIGYRETVSQKVLQPDWDQIKRKLNIDWTKTSWVDLEKPLYSGLASRLYLAWKLSGSIPADLQTQAQYWKTYYNTVAGSGTVQKFIDDVNQATGGCAV